MQETFTINGQTFATYACKFETVCNCFDNSKTIPVVIKGINGLPKTIEKLNCCTQGGGVGCSHWRHFTKASQGWYDKIPNRSGVVVEVKV